jgi:hypothetical protein
VVVEVPDAGIVALDVGVVALAGADEQRVAIEV